ncbi:hypothetical protein [Luteitalea sp.]|uniref:hypothetical protein n=1 Tax=Luteitalea sp. TaxID=2004800 RepID=UPI0025C0A61B|nr:hypothetical protein [Luteitalea sp.]
MPGLMLVGSPADTQQGFVERFDALEATKYREPSDDVYGDWHWDGARTVADMMAIIGHRIAQADAMPSFNAGGESGGRLRGQALPPADKP